MTNLSRLKADRDTLYAIAIHHLPKSYIDSLLYEPNEELNEQNTECFLRQLDSPDRRGCADESSLEREGRPNVSEELERVRHYSSREEWYTQ